mmetsp:Transcript_7861/g.10034  ORF Transcript_7861/g.10034 Transcript_7861/m.10034 type:complete len:90 (+) Transcript_7861:38-307(+)
MEKPSTISNHSPTDFAYISCLCITDDSVYSLTSCAYEDLNGIIYSINGNEEKPYIPPKIQYISMQHFKSPLHTGIAMYATFQNPLHTPD